MTSPAVSCPLPDGGLWRSTVHRPSELGPREIEAWHDFQSTELSLQNPFLAPEFAIAVDSVRSDARVAVVEESGRLAGFLAFSLGRSGVGRPIAPGMCDVQAFVHRPGLQWDPETILRSAKLNAWRFDHLLGRQAMRAASPAAVSAPAESSIIDLSQGWAGYANWARAERSRYFNWLERKRRRFAADNPDAEFAFMADDATGLADLRNLKSEQCRRMGWVDLFDRRWIRELVERLASVKTDALAGGLSSLRVNGKMVAADFSLRSATVYAGWLIAYDHDWATSSPGAVRWRLLLEAAAAGGIQQVDLGKGLDDFKRRFATGTLPLAEGVWGINSPMARALVLGERYSRRWRTEYPNIEGKIRNLFRAGRIRRYQIARLCSTR